MTYTGDMMNINNEKNLAFMTSNEFGMKILNTRSTIENGLVSCELCLFLDMQTGDLSFEFRPEGVEAVILEIENSLTDETVPMKVALSPKTKDDTEMANYIGEIESLITKL